MKISLTVAPAASGQQYDAVLQDWIILPLPTYLGTHLLVGIVTNDRKTALPMEGASAHPRSSPR